MNLKQIEMVGFKSFADPTKITFNDGITAIVGPNGCGKSNVSDAVRWVLGEQSSKMLRGTNMQDVIFKGTEKRKSLSYCEVSLFFDNSNHIFKTDYEEIVITRKLFRSGDSEYLLNKQPCRLKDIVDMLHDSGIGKSGYSIIGQGKVDEIINSKPEDRRAIFEEAAGIAKSKFKKLEAERKLERTQDNITRINDIISEIERQLKPMRHQSEIAKQYLKLKEDLKLQEVNVYIYQYDYAASNKEEISYKINQLAAELASKQKELEGVIAKYNSSFDKINHIDDEITELRDKVLLITVGMEKKAGESNLLRERLKNLQQEKARLEDLIKTLENQITVAQNAHKMQTAQKADKIKEKQQLLAKIQELNNTYNNITSKLESSENEAQEAQAKIFNALSKLGDVKAQISALNAERNTYVNQINTLEQSIAQTKQRLQESQSVLKASKQNVNGLSSTLQSLKSSVNSMMSLQDQNMLELKEVENKINTNNSNLISMTNRKRMLEDMQKEYEGYYGSVKRLLTDAQNNKQLQSKIVGVLANLITVPKQLESAIEMALGSAVQNIVTFSDDGAKELVAYLKQKEYGRATFLPINSVKPRNLDASYKSYLKASGVVGIASELITYDKQISNIISSLLGSTVVCEDLNAAVSLAKKTNYGFRIVTYDGDVINPAGSISGGSKKAQIANLLSRESNIAEAAKAISKLEREGNVLRGLGLELTNKINDLTSKLKVENEKVRDTELKLATENERCDKLNEITSSLEDEYNGGVGSLAKSKQVLSSIETELKKIERLQDNYKVDTTTTMENTEFASLRIKRDSYAQELTDCRIKVASIDTYLSSVDQDLDRLYDSIQINRTSIENSKQALADNNKLISELESISNDSSNKDDQEQVQELNLAKQKLASLDDYKQGLQASLRQLEEERMNLGGVVNSLQDKKYQEELNLSKIDTDIETMQERVWTEYELTYATAKDYKIEDFNLKNGMQEVARLKKQIQGLGNVNVNAIEDCKLLEERFGSLYDQSQDLLKAEADLKKIIKDLSNEMISRFEEEFNKINANFQQVFKELFGGGNAKLELLKSDDVLEAGVDIKAEPPGKKLSNITLLSGGEKALTAIAILFAILRLRPMPFCLLDEIEAPLDEANVDRFAKYLKKYSNETQFIVITHKKTTMEYADTLYGVTMEEKGVSKLVSVLLSDAIKSSEENNN